MKNGRVTHELWLEWENHWWYWISAAMWSNAAARASEV